MKHLIDKDAVLAIIEQLKNEAIDMEDKARWFLSAALTRRIEALEVKEVGFEKEKLTWEDIETIGKLRLNVALELRRKELKSPISNPLKFTKEDMCQEVLERFKAQKGESV